MAKMEIEFEITGLKLRIKGESDDVVAKVAAVQKQVQGVIQAVGAIADGANDTHQNNGRVASLQAALPAAALPAASARNGSRGATRKNSGSPRVSAEPIDFKHDAQKYGFPKQEWNTATKAMWLLHMLEIEAKHTEASAPVLAATFGKYFREFGKIIHNNITRDLSTLKSKGKSVNNDPDKDPQTWYLLEDGKREVERLIAPPESATTPE